MKLLMLIYILFLINFYSCNRCEPDINLGKLDLAEESKLFIPYNGNETLVFEDNNGDRHQLTSMKGLELLSTETIVRTICYHDFLDQQNLFYETQREQIAFFDANDKQIFDVDLLTYAEIYSDNDSIDIDFIPIYDFLLVSPMINGIFSGDIRIITKERKNHVSAYLKEEFWPLSRYIGDTIIYEREFKNVYKSSMDSVRQVFYNKEKGLIAIGLSKNEYWVLVD